MTPRNAPPRRRALLITASMSLTAMLAWAGSASGLEGLPPAYRMQTTGPGIINHPVGVVPSDEVTVPAGWPLTADGSIHCLTCHATIPTEADGSEPHLREMGSPRPRPGLFCVKCHAGSGPPRPKSVHWRALGVAHVRQSTDGPRGGMALDAHTRQCLSCHDGTSATESDNGTPWTRPGRSYDTSRNHPVGVAYDAKTRARGQTPLRPASLLPKEVMLPDGKVGCVSCHNLYAGTPYLLTVSIQGDRLCLTCHDR